MSSNLRSEEMESVSSPVHSSPFGDATDLKTSITASPVTVSGQEDGGFVSVPQTSETTTHNVTYAHESALSGDDMYKRPSSYDFAEQIRRLEIEGNKLRAATVSNLSNIGSLGGINFDGNDNDLEFNKVHTPFMGNLSSLVDISADQKTISGLRTQLETQRRETERLQKQLLGDVTGLRSVSANSSTNSNGHNMSSSSTNNLSTGGICQVGGVSMTGGVGMGSGSLPFYSSTQSKAAFSTIPSGDLPNSSLLRRPYDYQPPSHLERSLKESQEQVMELRKRLQEANESSDQQKRHFRSSVEELKGKLHDTILNRDKVLDLRQKESNNQEMLINKLQSSLTHVQDQCRKQEEALMSATKKMDVHNQSGYVNETALSQIRNLLAEREKRRGHLYFESESTRGQSATMLVHTLERCLQDLDHELNAKIYRASELESDLEELRKLSAEKEEKITKEFQEKLRQDAEDTVKRMSTLTAEHEKTLADTTERASTAKQQISALQSQMHEIERQHQMELRAKESNIRELQDKLQDSHTELLDEKTRLQEKRVALESSLDEVQRELIEVKSEKNELIQSQAAMEIRLEDAQSLVSRQTRELETERDRVQQQRFREEELRTQIFNQEAQLTDKQTDIERLERMLEVVKQECSAQVVDKVASAEKLERERYLDQIKTLSGQLATMTEKYNQVSVEHQLSCSKMDSLRGQVHDLTEKLEKARLQMESALTEKNELTSMLGDKRGDLDRLTHDKDHYVQMADKRGEEISELKITVDRLKVQLEEKEKILSTFRQQSSNITQLMEVNAKANDNMRDERERAMRELQDKASMVEELNAVQDSLNKKLKSKDRKVHELEQERLKTTEDLALKSQELELLEQEKNSILKELKESRQEVSTLTSSKDALKKELSRVRMLRTKEVNKLQTKLKESEQEYKLSQKALRSKDIVDCKAVKFADKIQKEMTVKRSELDQLMSKLHRLEEKLETTSKEKVMVEKDKDSLKKSLAKSLLHTQELTEELQTTQAQNQELIKRVAEMEEGMEKATLKSSASQSQLEKCEQEIATLKLKHQLDIKEAERIGSARSGGAISYMTGSSHPSLTSVIPERDLPSGRKKQYDTGSETTPCTSDGCESDVPSVRNIVKNTLELRDEKHKEYGVVGKELKTLLSEMRNLISGHRECVERNNLSPREIQRPSRKTLFKWEKDGRGLGSAPLRVQDLRAPLKTNVESDGDKSWASKSLTDLGGELSDFSSYKEWRPRSHSLTRHNQSFTSDLDATHRTSFLSKGGYSDVSRLSQSVGTPRKPSGSSRDTALMLVPDTQELCRRLEEKIDSLTRMGGNLQKENKEMADLINLQGQKLDSVKQIEKKTRERR